MLFHGENFLLFNEESANTILKFIYWRICMFKKLLWFLFFFTFSWTVPFTAYAQVIYEVQSGDSLFKISNQYHMNLGKIAQLNGLTNHSKLVLGQSIILPGSTYMVQSGDSLWKIASRHAISTDALLKNNGLTSNVIVPGQKLAIPHPPKMTIWTGTYFVPRDQKTNTWMLNFYKNTLSGLFIFDYQPDNQGNLKEMNENEANMIAWKNNLVPYATLTNISKKGYDPDLIHQLLSNHSIRKNLIRNIYSLLDSHDYKGIVIDFEQVQPRDRDHLNQFMKELAARLHPVGMEVMIAVPPKEGNQIPDYYDGYDYQTLGKYVDKMFLMTYNWHWPGGPSGPIAPINKVRDTLNYAVSVVPKSKLLLGIPQYAYDWTITGEKRTGTAYSTQHAIDLYIKNESQVHYDPKAASPWFRYTDKNGISHEVWFEDPRSLLAKFRLVREYGLAGTGCWHLGLTMPQTEEMLLEEFKIVK
jgi:spore germination protein